MQPTPQVTQTSSLPYRRVPLCTAAEHAIQLKVAPNHPELQQPRVLRFTSPGAPPHPLPDPALKHFRHTLDHSGYRQFYLAFGDANFRKADWLVAARGLGNPLLDLVNLFLLQEPVSHKRACKWLGEDFLAGLLDCGVLREQQTELVSNSFYLIFCRSHALFCQLTGDPFAYFGDDSLALATLQTPAPAGQVLDLCCGPGIQTFVAAHYAAHVTGVELRPETWRIAELNRRLNGAGSRVEFVCQSAEDFARADARQYDRILFNPPLVPFPPGYNFALAGNGGPDGLSLTRRIIALYHNRLANTGSMEFIGTGLGRKNQPAFSRQLEALARRYKLTGRIHLLSQHPIRPGAPLFESCVSVLARDNELDAVEARKTLLGHFSKLGHDAYWLFFASLSRGSGRETLSLIDLTKSFWGSWFV